MNHEKLDARILRDFADNSNKSISNILALLVPKSLIVPILKMAHIKPSEKANQITKEMRKDYTILMPQMAPIHFELIANSVKSEGYNIELLKECTPKTVETGLKYVNNDACYPSILTTGQFLEALESGKYDVNKTAIIMSQTGGGCRATNYIAFIRKALKDAGFEKVPVISFNFVGMEKNPGFKLTISLMEKLLRSVIYGDLLQKMLMKNRAYEINKGESQKLFDFWMRCNYGISVRRIFRQTN